jgi:creatinine amidohydrolase
MSRRIDQLTSPAVASQIERSPIAVIPVGSIEQHGPHLPAGTDIYAADIVADALAETIDALVVPMGPYGVTPLHRGRPGTISLSPDTFEALLIDICSELSAGGIETIVLLNWHEGNTASLNRISSELQGELGAAFVVAQACYTAQRLYAGAGGKLTHGGSIETLAVLAYDESLVEMEAAGAVERDEKGLEVDEMRRSSEVYGFVTDVAELDPEGWYGDPEWAIGQDKDNFAGTLAADIAAQVTRVIDIRKRANERTDSE